MTLTTSAQSSTMPVSIITTCYGRNRHLYNLLSSLSHSSVRPNEVIIINDDADPAQLAQYPLNIVQLPTVATKQLNDNIALELSKTALNTGVYIGRNRNVGAAHATNKSLIFLDVDCVVSPSFIEQLTAKLQRHPEALLMGQPRYLTRPLTDAENILLQKGKLSVIHLDKLSVYNPYRHNIGDNLNNHLECENSIEQTQDYGAFWSLCFAISRAQFDHIGGFDIHYVGYGAEDTDFAFKARELDIIFYLTNDVIYHQQHSVYRPPLNHLASIVINANRFYDKWQHWPMTGWLAEFAQMRLIEWEAEQLHPISIIRQSTKAEIDKAYCPDAPYV